MSASDDRRILWQEEVRKGNVEQLVMILSDIRDSQCKMGRRMDGLEAGISSAIKEHIVVAFAGGDPDGHRRAHEVMIDMLEERRRLVAAIKEKTVAGLIWAAAIWVGLAALNEIRHAIGLPPLG